MRTPLARPSPTSSRASCCADAPAAMRSVRGRSRMRSRIAPVSPSATSRPLTRTTTRGAMRSTSCSTCEETSTVRPSAPSRRMSSTTWRRWTGSRPFSGSSSSSSSGECTSAWASLTRCRMPFEKPPTRRSAASSRPTLGERLGGRGRGIGHAAQAGHQLDQLARGQERPEAVAVVDDADAPVDVGLAPRVEPEHAHRAGARIGEAGAQRKRGRLAGAVVAEQARHAGRQLERHFGQGDGVAVPLGDALEDERQASALR